MNKRIRSTSGMAAFAGTLLSLASWAGEPTAATDSTLEEVVVTGSRLTTGGFSAPTPTQTLGAEDLEQLAQPNIAAAVAMLPALTGSPNTTVGNGGTGTGNVAMAQLNLRALGTFRTLVLMDGQRWAPALNDGSVDITALPQLLIQKVDVVTGGASASYGSDAVAGVVNFITDTKFTGLKVNAMGGVTTYDDDRSILAQVAWGGKALGDRFHVQASGEFYKNNGVAAPTPGIYGAANGRGWFDYQRIITRTPATTPAGQPQNFLFHNTQFNTFSYGGLITAGPLRGVAFGVGGNPYNFQYGSPCVGSQCVGGDLSSNVFGSSASFDAPVHRGVFYTRMSYDLSPNVELYGSLSYTRVATHQQPNAGAAQQANLTIQCANPYVPQSIKTACTANNITSFQYGVSNLIFPRNIDVESNRGQLRFVGGLNAKDLNLFGKPWTLQVYAEHAKSDTDIDIHNVMLLPRYQQAIQATTAANGAIVCSSTVAQAAGCVPLNIIGINPVSEATFSYIAPLNGPYFYTDLKQQVISMALSGAPVDLWAGPLAVAVGGEWRQESYVAKGDPYGAGTDEVPNDASYPADLVTQNTASVGGKTAAAVGNNWYAGNFHTGRGLYNVREAFLEVGLPLFNNGAGKFDLNLAGRETRYSTAGSVFTWKAGGVWDTPLTGLRVRAVRSQDIRAPNLNDLYAPTLIQSNGGIINRLTGQTVTAVVSTVGNTALTPEIAQNTEIGVVFQHNGFSASVDYYNIKIDKGIQALTAQQMVDLCQTGGNASACQNVTFASGGAVTANTIKLQPFNGAIVTAKGIDVAMNWQSSLSALHLPGRVALSGQASFVKDFLQDTGLPGQPLFQAAGANTNPFGGTTAGAFGIAPKRKAVLTESWTGESLTLTLVQRMLSAGYLNPNWIQCSAGSCPVPTVEHATIDDNHIPGVLYLDIAASYAIPHGQVYAKIDNALNKTPSAISSPSLYDWLGRTYRVGVRLRFD